MQSFRQTESECVGLEPWMEAATAQIGSEEGINI